jgi:hypothetical protein
MNTALLLQWLNLPPGPWPPDDRALLGLAAGPIDAAQAESNALARMEQLRPHQLKHPEIVTEGMNRLAQALIALSAPADSNSPTESLRKPVAKAHPKPKPKPAASPFPAVDLAPTAPQVPAPTRVAEEPVLLEAPVIVEAEVVVAAPLPALPLPALEAVPAGLVEIPEIPLADDRRKGYRRIAYLRRLLRAWQALQPVVAVPSEPLASAEMVYRTLVGFADLRLLLRRGRARYHALDLAGASVLALAGQAHAVLVLRELLPGQRQVVAMDWATAKASLEAQIVAVRRSLKRPRRQRRLGDSGRAFGQFLQQNPEWILTAFTVLLILSGIARTLAR